MAAAREAARAAGLRADRQQKIVNRRQTLRNLWRTELQNDRSLLHKPWDPQAAGAGANIPRPYNLRPWLKIKSFDNSPYILEEISKYVKSRLSQADRDELDDFYNDQSFDRNDVFLGFKDDVLDVEPDDGIGLVAAVMQEEQEDNSSPELWVQVQTLLELLARLRVMRRFADGRNPELPSAPLPDGSNIPGKHHSLITAWVLHRAWIRALHYRTLKIGDYALGFHHMKDILKLSLALYALELKDVSYDPVSDQNNLAGFGWIRKIHSQVEKALIALSRYLDTETRSGRNGYTYSQGATIAYNIDPNRLGAAIQQILSTLDPKWELWSAILQKAAALEKASDVLHVENVEVEKKVVLDDEMFYVMGEMNDPNYDARGFYNTPEPAVEEDEETVLTHLQRISEMNRLRRNKLLLTNWNESGPWKQLYVMFDTSPTGKPDFVTLISKFWDRADKLQTHFLLSNGPPGPSNSGNIWSKLFPIHPLASTDAPDPTRLGAYYDKGKCVICYEDFPDTCDRVLMRLKCDHWYHFTCIRNMWDQPDNYSYPCPMCRLTPHNWRLHEHAGITPEVRALDVWDFEELMSPGHIFGEPGKDPHPDLTVYYHNEDQMHFNMAMTFTRQHGYTNIDPLEPDNQALWRIGKGGVDEFRAPRTEMAVLRRKKRDRNKKRKDLMITARKGFEGLDPEEEDALDG